MNNLDFLQALGELPESYYSECLPRTGTVKKRQLTIWYSAAVLAACIGVVFAFGYTFVHHEKHTEPSNPGVSVLTETTSAQSSAAAIVITEESDSSQTTDTEGTALTTEHTTTDITPVFS